MAPGASPVSSRPMATLRRMRVERAATLLEGSTLSLSQVARAVREQHGRDESVFDVPPPQAEAAQAAPGMPARSIDSCHSSSSSGERR